MVGRLVLGVNRFVGPKLTSGIVSAVLDCDVDCSELPTVFKTPVLGLYTDFSDSLVSIDFLVLA